MTFDELLAIMDDTNIDVYDTTETDFHHTLWRGHDYDFTYDQVEKNIQDCEVVRVWADGDVLNVFVDTAVQFEDEPEPPKKKFYVNVSMGMPTSFCIEAEDKYDALDKAERLMWSRPFFDELIENIDFRDKGSLDMLYDSMRVENVEECTDPDVDPLYVDGFLK